MLLFCSPSYLWICLHSVKIKNKKNECMHKSTVLSALVRRLKCWLTWNPKAQHTCPSQLLPQSVTATSVIWYVHQQFTPDGATQWPSEVATPVSRPEPRGKRRWWPQLLPVTLASPRETQNAYRNSQQLQTQRITSTSMPCLIKAKINTDPI